MHSLYVKYVYTWELVQCKVGPLGLSVAAFFSGRVSNSLQGRAIQMRWCFGVVFSFVFFLFFTAASPPNGVYTTCLEAPGKVKAVLTLKAMYVMQQNRYEY